MKTFLKFSGIIAFVVALVGFILMMATNAVVVGSGSFQVVYKGTDAIFGNKDLLLSHGSAMALIAWILGLVGLLLVCFGIILPLLKNKKIDKFAGLLNLVAVICLVLAGVFMFFVVPTFFAANDIKVPDNAAIGAGWVIGGILFIGGGALAILPAAMDFLGKKK